MDSPLLRSSRAWLRRLVGLVVPPVCLGCRRIDPLDDLRLGLCLACRGRLVDIGPGCAACGRPLAGAGLPPGWRCGHCRRHPPSYERLLAGWSYRPPFDAVIRGLKFGRLDYLGGELAAALAARFGERLAGFDLVAPIPLHWRRRLARGYNQSALIARPLGRLLEAPPVDVLRRGRSTRPQTALPRSERASNVQGSFTVRRRAELPGRSVLLVDDVVTTGATLEAAAAALKKGGAARVVALAAGRTPDNGMERIGFDRTTPRSI